MERNLTFQCCCFYIYVENVSIYCHESQNSAKSYIQMNFINIFILVCRKWVQVTNTDTHTQTQLIAVESLLWKNKRYYVKLLLLSFWVMEYCSFIIFCSFAWKNRYEAMTFSFPIRHIGNSSSVFSSFYSVLLKLNIFFFLYENKL